MARARNRVSQCAVPVGTVKADGKVMIWAFWRLSARLISGKRSCFLLISHLSGDTKYIMKPTSKHTANPTRPTAVSNGGRIKDPLSTLLAIVSTRELAVPKFVLERTRFLSRSGHS